MEHNPKEPPNQIPQNECRTAFEKWAKNKFNLESITGKGYTSKRTSYCWYAWEASWAARSHPTPESSSINLEKLKMAIDQQKSVCADDHTGNTYKLALDNLWNLIKGDASNRKTEEAAHSREDGLTTSPARCEISVVEKFDAIRRETTCCCYVNGDCPYRGHANDAIDDCIAIVHEHETSLLAMGEHGAGARPAVDEANADEIGTEESSSPTKSAALDCDSQKAYGYASRLFKLLAPQCQPLDTTLGVLTQLDNYIAGLRTPKPVSVSLEKCIQAIRTCEDSHHRNIWPSSEALAKAVLDAAGVTYVS